MCALISAEIMVKMMIYAPIIRFCAVVNPVKNMPWNTSKRSQAYKNKLTRRLYNSAILLAAHYCAISILYLLCKLNYGTYINKRKAS